MFWNEKNSVSSTFSSVQGTFLSFQRINQIPFSDVRHQSNWIDVRFVGLPVLCTVVLKNIHPPCETPNQYKYNCFTRNGSTIYFWIESTLTLSLENLQLSFMFSFCKGGMQGTVNAYGTVTDANRLLRWWLIAPKRLKGIQILAFSKLLDSIKSSKIYIFLHLNFWNPTNNHFVYIPIFLWNFWIADLLSWYSVRYSHHSDFIYASMPTLFFVSISSPRDQHSCKPRCSSIHAPWP